LFYARVRFKLLALFILLALSSLGCDQISAIKDYFSKPKAATVKKNIPAKPAPQEEFNEASGPMPANAIVRIGKWTLDREDFQERLEALKEVVPDYDINDQGAKGLILEEIVRQQLLVLDAERSGLAQDKDIQAAVDEFRRTLIVREVARKLTEDIEVTEEDAREFYDANIETLIEPPQLRVSEIVVETQDLAKELLIELLKDADFAEIAKEHSISQSAQSGGDLGFINEIPFPQMGSALLSLEEGDLSSVFKGPDGYYIIKLDEKSGGEPLDFDTIKEEIIARQLLGKQQEAIMEHLNTLSEEFKVEVNEDLL